MGTTYMARTPLLPRARQAAAIAALLLLFEVAIPKIYDDIAAAEAPRSLPEIHIAFDGKDTVIRDWPVGRPKIWSSEDIVCDLFAWPADDDKIGPRFNFHCVTQNDALTTVGVVCAANSSKDGSVTVAVSTTKSKMRFNLWCAKSRESPKQ